MTAVVLLAACGLTAAVAEEVPEIEFLEYLGMWEETDEDWVMFSESMDTTTDDEQRSESEPAGEDSTETNDER